MKSYIEIMILFLMAIKKSGQFLMVPEKGTTTFSECIIYILNKYFNDTSKISVSYTEEYTSEITEISKNTDLPILLNADEAPHTEGIDTTIPIDVNIIIDDSMNISKILSNKWTQTTQFLVILPNSQSPMEKMIEIFREFWENNVVNVLSLIADKNEVQIFTFEPFNRHDCSIHKPVKLATFTSGQTTSKKEIIQNERVRNLNGCTLNASVLDSPPNIIFPDDRNKKKTDFVDGVEGLMLTEFSNRLNFKLNVLLDSDYGWVKPKPTGAVGDVFLKKSQFACGNIAYNQERFQYFDLSSSIGCDIECISWAVPIGAKKSQEGWISLFAFAFSNIVWYVMVATFISVAATFRILSKTSSIDEHQFNETTKTIFYTLRSSLGAAVQAPKSTPLKILFSAWLWYCFIIISAYQALIGSKLTVPFRQPNVDTFEDLLESDLQISGLRFMFRLLSEAQKENENIKALGDRFKPSSFRYDKMIEKLIYDRNVAFVGTMSRFMYNVMQNPKAKGLVNFMKECVRKYYPVMLLQKNSPLTYRVDQIIRILFESGITCHWKKQFVHDGPQAEPSVEKLSLVKVKGLFYILAAGLSAALLVFLAENVLHWYMSRELNRKNVTKNLEQN